MKKFKLVSIMILVSMVLSSVILPLKTKASGITASKFSIYDELIGATKFGVIEDRSESNKWVEEHFVDIDSAKKSETVVKYEPKDGAFQADGILDSKDVTGIKYLTGLFLRKNATKAEYDTLKNWCKDNKEKFGINEEISDFKLKLNVTGVNGTVLNASVSDTETKTLDGNDFVDYATTVKNLAQQLLGEETVTVPDDRKYSTEDTDQMNAFYLIYDKSTATITISINEKEFYFVCGYNGKNDKGAYLVDTYFVSKENQNIEIDTFETELSYEAYIGTTKIDGKTENETFKPGYDETNIKEDADVTAIINSKNKEEIVKVNDKEVTNTPSKDQPWYYPNTDDTTKVAKQYPFDTYDNSTDNGMVSEKVTLTSSDDKTSEQNVSIKWPFRIIDKTYDPETPTDDTKEVTVTIETNLPMDENKIPEGWTIVKETDNHKISRTYKKGDKVDEDVTVYQNKTGETDKTHVKYTWPGEQTDKSVANKALSQTGEKVSLALIIAVIAIVAAIVINKKKNNLNK